MLCFAWIHGLAGVIPFPAGCVYSLAVLCFALWSATVAKPSSWVTCYMVILSLSSELRQQEQVVQIMYDMICHLLGEGTRVFVSASVSTAGFLRVLKAAAW